jgi:hypothetical protein
MAMVHARYGERAADEGTARRMCGAVCRMVFVGLLIVVLCAFAAYCLFLCVSAGAD